LKAATNLPAVARDYAEKAGFPRGGLVFDADVNRVAGKGRGTANPST